MKLRFKFNRYTIDKLKSSYMPYNNLFLSSRNPIIESYYQTGIHLTSFLDPPIYR